SNVSELPTEPLEFCRCDFCVHFLSPRDETLKGFSYLRVVFGPRIVEYRDDFFLGQAFDLLRANECGITPIITNLLCEPLELLVLGRLIRQEIRRCFNLDGAEFS